MGRRTIATISIISLIALYGLYYCGIPAALNTPRFENFIERQIQKNSGLNIDLVNPEFKMGLLPAVWLKADEISVINNDKSKPLKLENPALKLQLFPLILKHANISVFNANNTTAALSIDKRGQIFLGQYPLNFDKKSKITLNKIKINLNKYYITLNDNVLGKKIIVDGKTFKLEDFEKDKRAKFSTKSSLIVDGKPSIINASVDLRFPINKINEDQLLLNADIENLDLSLFKIYVK